jgi:hypothetical protein
MLTNLFKLTLVQLTPVRIRNDNSPSSPRAFIVASFLFSISCTLALGTVVFVRAAVYIPSVRALTFFRAYSHKTRFVDLYIVRDESAKVLFKSLLRQASSHAASQ